jgi:hypothetical protein
MGEADKLFTDGEVYERLMGRRSSRFRLNDALAHAPLSNARKPNTEPRKVACPGEVSGSNCQRSESMGPHPVARIQRHHRSRSTGGLGRVRYGSPLKCTAGGVVPYAEQQPRLAGATVEQN